MIIKNIILIVVSVILILFSGFAGYGLGLGGYKLAGESDIAMLNLIKSSTVVPVTNALGKIVNISGRDITLSKEGKELTISILPEAKFFNHVSPDGKGMGQAAETTFESVKLNDSVIVDIKILQNNQVQGTAVRIIP
jgi:hypothetical protein